MKLFNFLKRKKTIEKNNENKEVLWEELGSYILTEQKKVEENKSEFFESVHNIILEHSADIEKKVETLESIDIDSKKIEERAKIIVKQSVEKYVTEVKKLLFQLKNSRQEAIEEFINQVNQSFAHFDKRSAIFYGRSNYIIGDELLTVKNSIQKIHQEFSTLLNSKKETIEKNSILQGIISSRKIIEEKTDKKNESKNQIKKIDLDIQKKENLISEIDEDIEKTKKSEEYSLFRKSLEEIDAKKQSINKMILECKSLINFKELMGLYYASESKRELIKKYKDSFSIEFRESNIQDFLSLIVDSKITNRDKILTLAENIAEKKEEKVQAKKLLGNNPLTEKENRKKRYVEELKKLQEAKRLEKKIEESFDKEIEKSKIAIKERLETLNIKLI